MTLNRIAAACAAGLLMSGAAIAADPAPVPAGYVKTGKTESCLRLNRIESMQILNETQILVETSGGKVWLQEPRSCSKLRKSYAFVYEAPTGDLCDTTIVKLADPGISGSLAGTCSFDKFQLLERQTASAD